MVDLLLEKILTKVMSPHLEVLSSFCVFIFVTCTWETMILIKNNHSTGVLNQKIIKNRTWFLVSEFSIVHPRVFPKPYS